MTDIKKQKNDEYIDANLDRLLNLGRPSPVMPEDLKNNIRSRLLQMTPDSSKKNIYYFRRALLPLAVAASLIFFLLFLWKGDLNGTISWADVQKHLDNVHTVVLKVKIITSTNDGNRTVINGEVYHKDPGLTRSEIYGEHNDPDMLFQKPQAINIDRRESGRSELLTLQPGSNQAEWTTRIFRTTGPENPPALIVDLASENWKIMKKLTEDNTRFIGDRVINGTPAVGFSFEGPARDIIRSPDVTGQAHGKIFVRPEDGSPIYVEAESQTKFGQTVRLVASDIQWNVPLEDSLFYLSVPDGWQLKRTWIETAEYTDAKLAPDISLEVGLDGREPSVKAEDVAGVVKAEQTTYPKSDTPGYMKVTIQLKKEAFQSLRRQAKANPQKIIVVNFNGESKSVTRLDENSPGQLVFDLSWLSISLNDLENRYFIKTTTVYKGDEK